MPEKLRHSTSRPLSPGRFYPCGATLGEDGVNFALFSQHATEVFLLLFDAPHGEPTDVIRLEHKTRYIWHTFVHDVGSGQLYGYKVLGPYAPSQGMRFNGHRLLVDPYARAITGKVRDSDGLLFAFDRSSGSDLVADIRDNDRIVPKGIVIDDTFDWRGDVPPQIPFEDLVLYETHLKGFTAHPSSGATHPGTYLGFIEKIPYLKKLGVNAVEFLPLQEFYVEDFLINNGLTNYWGYNTICFFAPEVSYAAGNRPGCQVEEFKTLVRELHAVGIEVIMDVVYNHTGEGNEQGPTISFKGIDNRSYYCLTDYGVPGEEFRYYLNYTGCGNSFKLAHASVLKLVMDSLRYWVEVMHVDGFRFDLASVLGRGESGMFEKGSSFFDAISQDPVLNRVKLIAEPWDMSTYQVGNFPVDWSEWNGRFRDTVRRFVRGDGGQLADLGWRLTGSADLYKDDGRSPYNSINFITCHDGFTLGDLVSYERKHNEGNKENNNDGSNENYSQNCGVEGETDDPAILELRRRLVKSFLCILFFSKGTPMLLAGDEFLRTQKGNNNAYCQDNEITWVDWNLAETNADLVEFCRKLIRFSRNHQILRRKEFFEGCIVSEERNICDIAWFDENLAMPDWHSPTARTLCFQLYGMEENPTTEYQLYFVLNMDARRKRVRLPHLPEGKIWRRMIDTSLAPGNDFLEEGNEKPLARDRYTAKGKSVAVFIAK